MATQVLFPTLFATCSTPSDLLDELALVGAKLATHCSASSEPPISQPYVVNNEDGTPDLVASVTKLAQEAAGLRYVPETEAEGIFLTLLTAINSCEYSVAHNIVSRELLPALANANGTRNTVSFLHAIYASLDPSCALRADVVSAILRVSRTESESKTNNDNSNNNNTTTTTTTTTTSSTAAMNAYWATLAETSDDAVVANADSDVDSDDEHDAGSNVDVAFVHNIAAMSPYPADDAIEMYDEMARSFAARHSYAAVYEALVAAFAARQARGSDSEKDMTRAFARALAAGLAAPLPLLDLSRLLAASANWGPAAGNSTAAAAPFLALLRDYVAGNVEALRRSASTTLALMAPMALTQALAPAPAHVVRKARLVALAIMPLHVPIPYSRIRAALDLGSREEVESEAIGALRASVVRGTLDPLRATFTKSYSRCLHFGLTDVDWSDIRAILSSCGGRGAAAVRQGICRVLKNANDANAGELTESAGGSSRSRHAYSSGSAGGHSSNLDGIDRDIGIDSNNGNVNVDDDDDDDDELFVTREPTKSSSLLP